MSKSFKIFLGFIVYSLTTIVVLAAIAFWWAADDFKKPGPLRDDVFFTVERGEGLMKISEKLEQTGAIDNQYVFIFGARMLGAQRGLKAGEYQLTAAISQRAIMEKFRKGDTFKRRITLREGLTSYEATQILKQVPDLDGTIEDVPPEGSLLPQTYDYQLHEPREKVVADMKVEMVKALGELWPKRAGDLPFTTQTEAVTLASIVEKETGVPSERARIAGVFINRLRKGIPLQSDPTVIYALDNGHHQNNGAGPLGRHLFSNDLQVDSPYNTYLHAGLPPGPIANPGRAALEAALNPEANDYLYFVANGAGGHVFAKTLEEHNANVAKWRDIKREQNK